MIEDLLPNAILEMKDTWETTDSSTLIRSEFLQRRRWGKERRGIEEQIAQRREVLEEFRYARSSILSNQANKGGSLLLMVPQVAVARQSSLNYPLSNITEEEHMVRSPTPHNLMQPREKVGKYEIQASASNLKYVVDESLVEHIKSDDLFRKLCSTVEKTSRNFASIHKNNWTFTLKERRDIELPDWKRTILLIQLTGTNFNTALELWSTLSNETRKDLGSLLKRLPETDRATFSDLVSNFSVEMDF